jgi:hypothetical protein
MKKSIVIVCCLLSVGCAQTELSKKLDKLSPKERCETLADLINKMLATKTTDPKFEEQLRYLHYAWLNSTCAGAKVTIHWHEMNACRGWADCGRL